MRLKFECTDKTINRLLCRIRDKHWDIEIAIVVPKMGSRKNINLALLDITNRAWYKVPWSNDLKTARDIVEHYRPDLVEQYDKAHPNGEYNPYTDYSDESGQ